MAKKIIAIGSDHGGFSLKEKIKKLLEKKGYKIHDAGTCSEISCDYPEFGFEAAKKVSQKKAFRAIAICKTGIGMTIVTNKLPGVRAGVCGSKEDALSARRHNDINVLILAANKVSGPKAWKIVETWLKTGALKGRHARRVKQIRAFEKKVFK